MIITIKKPEDSIKEILEYLGFDYSKIQINEYTVWGDRMIKTIYIQTKDIYYKIQFNYAVELPNGKKDICYKVIHQYNY